MSLLSFYGVNKFDGFPLLQEMGILRVVNTRSGRLGDSQKPTQSRGSPLPHPSFLPFTPISHGFKIRATRQFIFHKSVLQSPDFSGPLIVNCSFSCSNQRCMSSHILILLHIRVNVSGSPVPPISKLFLLYQNSSYFILQKL